MKSKPADKPPASDAGPGGDDSLSTAVRECLRRPAFLAELRDVLHRADADADAQGAQCLGGGACCRFDMASHRLYVSTGELALLLAAPPADLSRAQRRRCPWQQGPRCVARDFRPLGCRIFFCRQRVTDAASDSYEKLHALVRQLHQTHCLPYAYAELTTAITQLSDLPQVMAESRAVFAREFS